MRLEMQFPPRRRSSWGFLLLFGFWRVVFAFFLTWFDSKQNYFKVEIVALAASQKEWDPSPARHQCQAELLEYHMQWEKKTL